MLNIKGNSKENDKIIEQSFKMGKMNDKLKDFAIDILNKNTGALGTTLEMADKQLNYMMTRYLTMDLGDITEGIITAIDRNNGITPDILFRDRNRLNDIIKFMVDVANRQIFLLSNGRNVTNRFAEFRKTNPTEPVFFRVKNTEQLAVSKIASGTADINRQILVPNESFTLPIHTCGISAYIDFAQLRNGSMTFTDLIVTIVESVSSYVKENTLQVFADYINNVPNSLKLTTNNDATAMVQHINKVEMQNRSRVSLVGTNVALTRLSSADPNYFSDTMKNELNMYGRLGVWKGYDLIELPNLYKTSTDKAILPDNTVFLLDTNEPPVKILQSGDMFVDHNSTFALNYQDFSVGITMIGNFGFGMISSKLIGVIQFTN